MGLTPPSSRAGSVGAGPDRQHGKRRPCQGTECLQSPEAHGQPRSAAESAAEAYFDKTPSLGAVLDAVWEHANLPESPPVLQAGSRGRRPDGVCMCMKHRGEPRARARSFVFGKATQQAPSGARWSTACDTGAAAGCGLKPPTSTCGRPCQPRSVFHSRRWPCPSGTPVQGMRGCDLGIWISFYNFIFSVFQNSLFFGFFFLKDFYSFI